LIVGRVDNREDHKFYSSLDEVLPFDQLT